MEVLLLAAGISLILTGITDVFFTVLHPDGFGFLSSRLYNGLFASMRFLTRPLPPRPRALGLSMAAPLMVPVTITVWIALVLMGYAFVYYAGMSSESFNFSSPGLEPSLGEALYVSGTAISTLGFGDVTPADGLYQTLAVSEALIGFGILAPILLVTLRIVQGIGLGGEWGGAALMVSEHAPPNRRGFYASSVQMGAAGGLVLSSATIAGVSQLMSQEQFVAWGWRIPFLASVILIAVGLFIRFQLAESEAFIRLKEAHAEARMPIIEVFRTRTKNVLLAAGTSAANNVFFYTVSVFTISYGTSQLGLSQSTMLMYLVVTALVYFFTLPAFGVLSDRIGRRELIIASNVIMALVAFPYFWFLDSGSGLVILLAMIFVLAVFQSGAYAPQSAFIPELFDTRVRYSGAALGYNLATMVFGGTAPFIATALFAWAGENTWAVSLYMIAVCVVSLVSVYLATETPMLRESYDQRSEQRATTSGPGREATS